MPNLRPNSKSAQCPCLVSPQTFTTKLCSSPVCKSPVLAPHNNHSFLIRPCPELVVPPLLLPPPPPLVNQGLSDVEALLPPALLHLTQLLFPPCTHNSPVVVLANPPPSHVVELPSLP